VSARFAWRFWTDVRNWDDPPAQFMLDGPFADGSRGTTVLPGQAPSRWCIRDVRSGRSATIEMELEGATLGFEWYFTPLADRKTKLTQRLVLSGEQASRYADQVRAAFGPNLPAGMARVAAAMVRAEVDGTGTASSFEVRRAGPTDVEEIAAAHLDSIRSIGSLYYPPVIVSDWGARIKGDLYVNAMACGEVFYLAIGQLGDQPEVLGFSSHRIDGQDHRTAVYVKGKAARRGIGSALFRSAEAAAIGAGATSLHVDASLAAIEFYEANGFDEVGRGEHRLASGRSMACVFMRKNLPRGV